MDDAPRLELSRRLCEFLTAFGYRGPALSAVAVHVHFGIEPARIVESTSLDEGDSWHDGRVREDRRPALRTKVPLNGLAAIADVVKRLKLSLNRHRRFRNTDENRERGPGLPLTMGAVAHAD